MFDSWQQLRRTVRHQIAWSALTAGALLVTQGQAAADLPVLLPPALDFAEFCPTESPAPLPSGIDWVNWSMADGSATADDAMRVARVILAEAGTDREVGLARQILTELTEPGSTMRGAALYELARLDIASEIGDAAAIVDMLRLSLASGYHRAAILLGQVYLEGYRAQPVDLEQAKFHFKLAVQSGSEVAALALARIAVEEEGEAAAQQWVALAQQYIMLRLSAGDCGQLRRMAELYLDGEFGAVEPEAAVAWLAVAHQSGDAGASLRLASLWLQGGIVPANPERAVALLEEMSAGGNPNATLVLARWNRGDFGAAANPSAARTLFLEAAQSAQAPVGAMVEAARTYRDGLGGPASTDHAIAWFERAVAAGSLVALRELGWLNLNAESPEQSAQGLSQLTTAAAAGDIPAAVQLGRWLLERATRPTDIEDAVAWLDGAVAAGDIGAAKTLARYFDSHGNPHAALRYWQSAAAGHDVEALVALASAVRGTPAVADELGTATELILRALEAAEQDPAGFVIIGRAVRDGRIAAPDGHSAFSLFRVAAAREVPSGLREAGHALARGDGVVADPAAGQEMLADAAALGDSGAVLLLAQGLIEGWFGQPDVEAAQNILEASAATGSIAAARRLGDLHSLGLFGGIAPREALRWWSRAAEAGDPRAMLALSNAAAAGFGMPVDLEVSVTWLKRAAALGDNDAMRRLAYAYLVGLGVEVDADEAAHWLALAAPADAGMPLIPGVAAR